MTNAEKFMQIMNETFDTGMTAENMMLFCSPCGEYISGKCDEYTCEGCKKWWNKKYVPSKNHFADAGKMVEEKKMLQNAIQDVKDAVDVCESNVGAAYFYKHNGGDKRLKNVLECLLLFERMLSELVEGEINGSVFEPH